MATTHTMDTVTSADGTEIAFERTGSGPPLVLINGIAGDHTRWEMFDVRPALAQHDTIYAMDRRGLGGSGDGPEYTLEREFEDAAAIVDSIDEPANLLGHSHGATCALGGALLTDNVRSLILYEASVPWEILGPYIFDEAVVSELEALLDEGENEQALVVFYREVLGLPSEALEAFQSDPSWHARLDCAHTIPRELRAPMDAEFDLDRVSRLTIPTLVMVGGESPQWGKDAMEALDDALPNSRIAVLEGQGHFAMNTAPELFVEEVLAFVRSPSEP
ncbi:alpha/beta fold hydrolase [Halalkalicoccus salilacus]|uniref:alpha/beta fold hydrolase n=1 Tax=Halalkalicoccus salilacus TaxID=3117459 RepID=UPI00300E934C